MHCQVQVLGLQASSRVVLALAVGVRVMATVVIHASTT
jgi:hypothetical protein